jgi:hypothetical protein
MKKSYGEIRMVRIASIFIVVVLLFSMLVGDTTVATAQQVTPICRERPITITQKMWDEWLQYESTSMVRQCQYEFYGYAGQYVSIVMERYYNGSSLDPYLELKDAYGRVIASDDDSRGNSNSWIDGQRLPRAGYYTIVARSYQDRTYGKFWIYMTKY